MGAKIWENAKWASKAVGEVIESGRWSTKLVGGQDMGKMLRCRAENPVMPASQMEDTWALDINCK